MNNLDPISLLLGLAGGVVLGVLLNLLFNKFRSGSASPATIKKELEDYQQKVEAHFDETSDKFRAMAEQYKDLYQHLSVGATTLCRPDHTVPGLSDDSNPLEKLPKKATTSDASEPNVSPSAASQKTEASAAHKEASSSAQAEQGPVRGADSSPDELNNTKQAEKSAAQ